MSIADLPNELLLAIFENLLNSSSPSFANPPSRISEVCRLWRSQSLLIPDLRTVLPLVTLGPTSRTLRGPLNTNAALSFAMRGVSSRHKKNRPKLNDAFSFLESGRGSAQDACQVLVCLPVPFRPPESDVYINSFSAQPRICPFAQALAVRAHIRVAPRCPPESKKHPSTT